MEITIKGSPEDITKLLQTIASSQERGKANGGGLRTSGNHAMKMSTKNKQIKLSVDEMPPHSFPYFKNQ